MDMSRILEELADALRTTSAVVSLPVGQALSQLAAELESRAKALDERPKFTLLQQAAELPEPEEVKTDDGP